jgi:membrane protein implicated in regulation of membrane protease activity
LGRRKSSDFLRTDDVEKDLSFRGLVVDQRRQGKGKIKPHGCEWMKNATRLEEEETVKVVRNGVGGTKRVWNPATK